MPAGEDASERYLPRLLLQLRLVDGDRVIVQGAVKCRNVAHLVASTITENPPPGCSIGVVCFDKRPAKHFYQIKHQLQGRKL